MDHTSYQGECQLSELLIQGGLKRTTSDHCTHFTLNMSCELALLTMQCKTYESGHLEYIAYKICLQNIGSIAIDKYLSLRKMANVNSLCNMSSNHKVSE